MKAIMLAAGEGSRGYPFTYLIPKIFQQVGGIPLLEYSLASLSKAPEIKQVYFVVRSDSIVESLRNYVQKRKSYITKISDLFGRLGYKVDYTNPDFEIEVIKANGWGTGGDLREAINQITLVDELGEDFIVCNADCVTVTRLTNGEITPQLNFSDVIHYHKSCKRALGTVMTVGLVTVGKEVATKCGVAQLEVDRSFTLVRSFAEKPDIKDIDEKPSVNAGIYVIDSGFILSRTDEYLPHKPHTNLEWTLLERLSNMEKPMLAGYMLDLCAWFDVGTLDQLVKANIYITLRKEGF